MGRGVLRNYYKGHMDKTKGWVEAGEGGGFGWGGEKIQTTVIEQQFKKCLIKKKFFNEHMYAKLYNNGFKINL